MKVTANYHKKQPVAGVEYASEGYHLTLEVEPPPEIQRDRDKLRRYVETLFAECRTRVEEQLDHGQASTSPQPRPRTHPQARHRAMRRPGDEKHQGGYGGNGRSRPQASLKQINFIRSLSREAGLSDEDLAYLAEDLCRTRDLRSLSKRDASVLIEELQGQSSRRA